MLTFQQNGGPNPHVSAQMQTQNQPQQPQNPQDQQNGLQPPAIQTMRLRDDPPAIVPATRTSRKRKTPPSGAETQPAQPPPPPQMTQPAQHILPPTHLIHPPLPHMQAPPGLPPGYAYPPADYTPGGMPPPQQQPQQQEQSPPPNSAAGRALSSSKRAEQNRKAQRAFRERRDQHVKALESRSQLLDAALASADEANRRWEECRALVDQLRMENTALRDHISQSQMLPPGGIISTAVNHGAHQEEVRNPGENPELKNDSAEAKQDKE